MKLTVVKISKVTTNGNRILTFQGDEEIVKTAFGSKSVKRSYCMAVQDGTEPEVGFSAELPLSEYEVVTRNSTDEDTGEVLSVKWLHCK